MKGDTVSQSRRRPRKGTWGSATRRKIELLKNLIADVKQFRKDNSKDTKMITKFKCVVCGKLTAGRMPREGRLVGDGSERWPLRHKGADGKPCPGNIVLAEWIDIKTQK